MVSIRTITWCIIFAEYVSLVWNNGIVELEKSCLVDEIKNEITCNRSLLRANLENTNHLISSLTLYNWTEVIFDPDILLSFRKLKNFTLSKSFVKQIVRPFCGILPLEILNISYNDIEVLEPSLFFYLTHLKIIDLRFNKLHQFDPSSLINLPTLPLIYLVGNQWYCKQNFSWTVNSDNQILRYVADLDSMLCKGSIHNGKPLRQVMNITKRLDGECLAMQNNCSCTLDHVVRIGSSLRPMITVNCTKQNLTTLPRELPKHTSTLILTENKISNLDEFLHNEKYFHLLNVYLEYNEISSIGPLEGSPWLLSVRALNLKGNRLSQVPLHIFEYAFKNNHNIANLFLSENPWKCDCMFTTAFKQFLIKYGSVIKDVRSIQCSYVEDHKISRMPILGLSRNKICRESSPSTISFLNVLNYFMAIILILLLCDFAYNYYKYKKYRKLPWIVRPSRVAK